MMKWVMLFSTMMIFLPSYLALGSCKLFFSPHSIRSVSHEYLLGDTASKEVQLLIFELPTEIQNNYRVEALKTRISEFLSLAKQKLSADGFLVLAFSDPEYLERGKLHINMDYLSHDSIEKLALKAGFHYLEFRSEHVNGNIFRSELNRMLIFSPSRNIELPDVYQFTRRIWPHTSHQFRKGDSKAVLTPLALTMLSKYLSNESSENVLISVRYPDYQGQAGSPP